MRTKLQLRIFLLLFALYSFKTFGQWQPSHNPATNYTVNGTASYDNAAYTIQLSNGGPGTIWHRDVKSFLNPFTLCFDFRVTGGDAGIDPLENDGFTFMFALIDDAEGATIAHTGTGATGGGFGSLGAGKAYWGTKVSLFAEFDMSSNRATCSDPNDSNIHEHISLNPDFTADHLSGPGECVLAICNIMTPVPIKGNGAYNGSSTACPHVGATHDGTAANTVRDGSTYTCTVVFTPNGSGGGTFRIGVGGVIRVNQTIADLAPYYQYYPGGTQRKFMFGFGADNSQILAASRENIIISNLGYTCSALPVTLADFSAIKKLGYVDLVWTTVQEQNNSHFIVQHSADGETFSTFETVKGRGNANSAYTYSAMHSTPASGLNYYRLIQVDNDGTTTVSGIRVVNFENQDVFISPMPFNDETTIRFTSAQTATLYLYDMTGKIVSVSEMENSNTASVGKEIPQGTYILKVEDTESSRYFKIIKQ